MNEEDEKVTEVEAFAQKIAQQEDAGPSEEDRLHTRIAELLMINEKHQQLNGKLQTRLTEVEEDNKKLTQQIDDLSNVVYKLRKSGAL
jgi:septal ring factor EnvC (AmiA/AmiB activator)